MGCWLKIFSPAVRGKADDVDSLPAAISAAEVRLLQSWSCCSDRNVIPKSGVKTV